MFAIHPAVTRGPRCRRLCFPAFVLASIVIGDYVTEPPVLDCPRQHVARPEHVRRAGPHILLNRVILRCTSLISRGREAGLFVQAALIQHRKDTGLFSGDVDSTCSKSSTGWRRVEPPHYVQASDGRIVLAKNEPLAGGGRVSTHEDVTEQRYAEQERVAIRSQEQRRATIDSAIASFRPDRETPVQCQQQCLRHALDRTRSVRVVRAHLAAGGERGAGLQRRFRERGAAAAVVADAESRSSAASAANDAQRCPGRAQPGARDPR